MFFDRWESNMDRLNNSETLAESLEIVDYLIRDDNYTRKDLLQLYCFSDPQNNASKNVTEVFKAYPSRLYKVVELLIVGKYFSFLDNIINEFDDDVKRFIKNMIKSDFIYTYNIYNSRCYNLINLFNDVEKYKAIKSFSQTEEGIRLILSQNLGGYSFRKKLFDKVINSDLKHLKEDMLSKLGVSRCDFALKAIDHLIDMKQVSFGKTTYSDRKVIRDSYIRRIEDEDVLKHLHNRCWQQMFEKYKSNYDSYLEYCDRFKMHLNETERDLLAIKFIGKLRRDTYSYGEMHQIKQILSINTNSKAVKRLNKELDKIGVSLI